MKITILLRHIGPYHHVRLDSLCKLCDLSVYVYGDMTGVVYGEFKGERSYHCVSPPTNGSNGAHCLHNVLSGLAPDVVVLPGWSEKTSLEGLRWALDKNIPCVVLSDSQEQDDVRGVIKEWMKSRVVRLFSTALVAGQSHAQYIAKLGIPSDGVFTGYDVVDNAYFQDGAVIAKNRSDALRVELGLPEYFFLASNRFLKRKNILRLVEAYALYRKAGAPGDWGLVLLGDGEEKEAIEAISREFGVQKHIIMSGQKVYEELPIYYGLAGAFVHASLSEQWGLVINEAMASGLPVFVSNRCGCVPELVQEGLNGYAFDPYDVEGLAHHMIKVSSGEYDRKTMGEASQEIISHWTPEVFAENLCKAARKALEIPVAKTTWLDRAILGSLTIR